MCSMTVCGEIRCKESGTWRAEYFRRGAQTKSRSHVSQGVSLSEHHPQLEGENLYLPFMCAIVCLLAKYFMKHRRDVRETLKK